MHRTGMTELEVVLAVARRSSFRGAARIGHVHHRREQRSGRPGSAPESAPVQSLHAQRCPHRHRATLCGAHCPCIGADQSAGEEASVGPDRPSGTLRINAPYGAAYLLLDPLLKQYAQRYPEVRIDIVSESSMVDIVAGGFDAGIRLAESVPQDMIAVALSGDMRMLVVATPEYLERHGVPEHPRDLLAHQASACAWPTEGLYHWELERDGQKLQVDLPVRFASNELLAIKQAVLSGLGIGFISEGFIREELASGALVPRC